MRWLALLAIVSCVPKACDNPEAECHRAGGFMEEVPGSCIDTIQRTNTQPRFCSGSQPGEGDPPCWWIVRTCRYQCVIHKAAP